jgi:hypothetical protein
MSKDIFGALEDMSAELAFLRAENDALIAEVKKFSSHNTQIIPVCPHAKVKWVVCDCGIKSDLAYDFLDCTGDGTYSVPGNGGYGYSRQCGKVVPGKPA